jgi:hypothetical protein
VANPSTGRPYEYRINGLPVLIVTIALWAMLGTTGVVPFEWLYLHRWSGLAGAITLGIVTSVLLVAGAPPVSRSVLVAERVGFTLALGCPGMLLAWLYPLYYVVLLGTRQADDDRRCREKYGELWEEYEKRVPSRIIPGVY